MRAATWHGRHDMRVDNVNDPKIEHQRDAIIRITSTAICGSDLHLYNGVMAGMKAGDIIGNDCLKNSSISHFFMGLARSLKF